MSEQDTTTTRTGPGGWWYASAAVVVFVVACLVYVLARGGTEPPAAPAPVTTPTASAASPATTGSSTSTPVPAPAPAQNGWGDRGCHGDRGTGDDPAEALAAVTWEPFLSSALPNSEDLGPGKVEGDVRRCFHHSPAGAVVAAVSISAAAAVPLSGAAVIEEQFTAGPGRDRATANLAAATGQLGNLAAYRVSGCTPSRCNVQIIVFGSGIYVSGLVPMVWMGEDWMVDGSVDPGEGGIVQGIPTGFTPWGAL